MNSTINRQAHNLLHEHPQLYNSFIPDSERAMGHFIQGILEHFQAGRHVLDVGCGLGREVDFLTSRGFSAVGVDNSSQMIAWAQQQYPQHRFVYGEQSHFDLEERFDALICVGSTFLYNFSNQAINDTLSCFHRHLKPGGLMLLDMRNAAFFLTAEGQRWLREELVEHAPIEGGVMTARIRFSIDYAKQILKRTYIWELPEQAPIIEHLEHRLIFPQELAAHLNNCGFEVDLIFDEPAPHTKEFTPGSEIQFGTSLQGRRLQVIAHARQVTEG